MPKEITLLLCLQHNGVPLRHRGAAFSTERPLTIALRLGFTDLENGYSEAV